jgi:hypothetical protein
MPGKGLARFGPSTRKGFPSGLGDGSGRPFPQGIAGTVPAHGMEDFTMASTKRPFDQEDIAVWPDGTWAELGEVWNGHWNHKSDDYEIVPLEDEARLKSLGLAEDFDIP